jgi:hypothetical protein
MKVNGVSKTVTSWAVTGGLTATVNAEGLSFSNGVITWNGTTNTAGGIYTITATYSGTGIKTAVASAQVFVSQSSLVETMPATGYDTKWTVGTAPHKIGKVAQLDYVVISSTTAINYSTSYAFINDAAYKPLYIVTLKGEYDTGAGWADLGLVIFDTGGKLTFYGTHVPTLNVTFRLQGMWFVK